MLVEDSGPGVADCGHLRYSLYAPKVRFVSKAEVQIETTAD